jgi:hypothetical protein
MSDSFLIALTIIAVLALSVSLGYLIGRTSRRAGIAFATTGTLLGVLLIVNYFEELPTALLDAGLVAFAASIMLSLFDVVRKDVRAPSN